MIGASDPTVRGGTYWEDQTYSDQRVLLHIPKGFDPRRPALMVVFFHGNEATLERDVAAHRERLERRVRAERLIAEDAGRVHEPSKWREAVATARPSRALPATTDTTDHQR